MTGVSSVSSRPPSCRLFGEIELPLGALLTISDPRGHVIGKMPGMAFMVQRELFNGSVPGLELIEFVVKVPFPAAP
jgi:hypothetical protein